MPRVIPSLSLIAAAALLLTACASAPDLTNHLSNAEDSNNTSRVYPETLRPSAALGLPASIPFDEPVDLSAVTGHTFDSVGLEKLGWTSSMVMGIQSLTNGPCTLTLGVLPYSTAVGSLEIDSTATLLVRYMGTASWDEILPAVFSVNEGESALEGLTVSGIGQMGTYEIATARVLSGIDQAYLAVLSCEEGVATEKVFVDEIAPNISVTLT